jgi:glycosyltransferase involved in cell wall biosynthesis
VQIPIDELSLFFPCHNEAENLESLVADALSALPALAVRYEVILVDDGSRDATPIVAANLERSHPNVVRVIRHEVNRGYGGALRSGFRGARYKWIAFTDGDRQFRIADLAALIAGAPNSETVVLGYRIKRADPLVRKAYAALYRVANRLWFGLPVRDVDCAMKLFPRSALQGISIASNGAFFSAELIIKLRATLPTCCRICKWRAALCCRYGGSRLLVASVSHVVSSCDGTQSRAPAPVAQRSWSPPLASFG